jgi:hypothetical protein
MDVAAPRCTPGLRFYQWMLEKDRAARLQNQERLRDLKRAQGHRIVIFSSHDVPEFERLAGHAAATPAIGEGGSTASAPQLYTARAPDRRGVGGA